jgi:hypothetical protein
VPGGQSRHEVVAAALHLPAEQVAHATDEVDPVFELYVPPGQGLQNECEGSPYVPGAQSVQFAKFGAAENVPSAQFVQVVAAVWPVWG